MTLGFDQPWFILLWIVALSLLMLPIIVGGINAVVNNYFQAKEKHATKTAKLIAQALSETLGKKKPEEKEP